MPDCENCEKLSALALEREDAISRDRAALEAKLAASEERAAELLLRAEEPVEKWPFNVLVRTAREILDQHYPERLFPGLSGDPGPRFVAALRATLKEIAPD